MVRILEKMREMVNIYVTLVGNEPVTVPQS
jgi:hypothetical protein